MIKAVFFDLFFTLIVPVYAKECNEFDILHLSEQEWEAYAENDSLYRERALGLVTSEMEIIDKIACVIPLEVSDIQKELVLSARENRMKAALQNISSEILEILTALKEKGIQIGLISNADLIDCKFWRESPLYSYFDDAIFSCNVGYLKPDSRIYELAMANLHVSPGESLFVGDGGSDELYGAKCAGMETVFTEALQVCNSAKRNRITAYADYQIAHFAELLNCIS